MYLRTQLSTPDTTPFTLLKPRDFPGNVEIELKPGACVNALNYSPYQQSVFCTRDVAKYSNTGNNRIIYFMILFVWVLWLALWPFDPVDAQTNEVSYGVPAAPETPTFMAELNEPQGVLTLDEALTLALLHNPSLAVVAREIRAQDGSVQQAGLIPNPVLGASAQNVGNSVLQGFDGDSLTLSLSQTILLGGKRAKAIRVAELDRELAVWDYESQRMDVLNGVVLSYVEVLRAQQALTLADDMVTLADRMMEAVAARVQAGESSPVDETRARVSLASVQIEQQRAKRALAAARNRLASTWGSTSPAYEVALGQLEAAKPIPSVTLLMDRLTQNPDLARWASETVQRQATIELAKSRAIPDLTVSLGVQEFLQTGDYALGAGISIPLPFFNRNQGNIIQANQRMNKALDRRRNVEVLVATTLNTVYQQFSANYAEVTILEKTVLPGAQSAFDAVEEGYQRGRFNLLDVLDVQRTLFGAKIQHLGALASYHQSKAKIERLIGEPLEATRQMRIDK